MKIRDRRGRSRRDTKRVRKLPFIGPQPTPQTYRIDRAGSWVIVSMSSSSGQWVTFLKPDDADAYADQIKAAAVDVRAGASTSSIEVASQSEVEAVNQTRAAQA